MATKEEQIYAILFGNTYELACKELNVKHMVKKSYKEVFNVTREDIEKYINKNGFPKRYCDIKEDHMCEGLHFIEDNGNYEIFWLERGEKTIIGNFTNEASAKNKLLDIIINMSGTGIDFNKK
jgi:hypothetical protein